MMHVPSNITAYRYTPPEEGYEHAAILMASPHSSSYFPKDFKAISSPHVLNYSVDLYIDALIDHAPTLGVGTLAAAFSRVYIDPNRATDDLDPELLSKDWPHETNPTKRSFFGKGLIHRLNKNADPIYARRLTTQETLHRIENYYIPYHEAMRKHLDDLYNQHGHVLLIDMHSMWPLAFQPSGPHRKRPDIIISDRDGQSCDLALRNEAVSFFREKGYHVTINDRFKGVEIMKRYGHPQQNRHAFQVEINKRLYMDEKTLEKKQSFDALKNDITKFTGHMVSATQSHQTMQHAAE